MLNNSYTVLPECHAPSKSEVRTIVSTMRRVMHNRNCDEAADYRFSVNDGTDRYYNMDDFDVRFDDAAEYTDVSLYAFGKSPDDAKKLVLTVFFLRSCSLDIHSQGFTDAEVTDIANKLRSCIRDTMSPKVSGSYTDDNPHKKFDNTAGSQMKVEKRKFSIEHIDHINKVLGLFKVMIELVKHFLPS